MKLHNDEATMDYSKKEIERMKETVKNLKALLSEERKRKPKDTKRIREIENLIKGYKNSISGKYN